MHPTGRFQSRGQAAKRSNDKGNINFSQDLQSVLEQRAFCVAKTGAAFFINYNKRCDSKKEIAMYPIGRFQSRGQAVKRSNDKENIDFSHNLRSVLEWRVFCVAKTGVAFFITSDATQKKK